jgi:predicted dehydrogenase
MAKRLSMGVVGAGVAFHKLHLPNIARHHDTLIVSGVTARTQESAQTASDAIRDATGEKAMAFPDLKALLASNPDVVLLNVPIARTYDLAIEILRSGTSLICEKPLGETATQAANIVTEAERQGVKLAVCENFRYQPRFHRVREIVRAGAIGEPKVYFLNDLHYTAPDSMYAVTPWRTKGEHRGGYLLDGGSHIVAGLRAMVGATPCAVQVRATSFHPDYLGRPWDTALANLTFDSGLIGHLALGYGSPDREARHPKILGSEGTIALMNDRIEVWREDPSLDTSEILTDTSDGIGHEWDDFAAFLRDEAALSYSPWEAVEDLAVLDAVLAGADGDSVVQVASYR